MRLPGRFRAHDVTLAAAVASAASVAAILVRPGGLIPFSLLPATTVFAGLLAGPRVGAMGLVVYVAIGLVGFPVFASAPFGGLPYVLKPTFGFLLGSVAGAAAAGRIAPPGRPASGARVGVAALAGLAVLYAVGLPYMWLALRFWGGRTLALRTLLETGFLPFVLTDLVKGAVAGWLAVELRVRLMPARMGKRA